MLERNEIEYIHMIPYAYIARNVNADRCSVGRAYCVLADAMLEDGWGIPQPNISGESGSIFPADTMDDKVHWL